MEHEECLDEQYEEEKRANRAVVRRAVREMWNEVLKELDKLHGHPGDGLRETLLERLRHKHPELTLEELNVFLRAMLYSDAYTTGRARKLDHEEHCEVVFGGEFIELSGCMVERALREFGNEVLQELRELDGHPMHGLRTVLLERLRQKHPDLTVEELNVFLKSVLYPEGYQKLTE